MMNAFYTGCVESRADPLKLGRCKVRIVGIHTENTTLLPTKDLPWAVPLQPITSAAVSGIGISPTGVVEGSWVLCIFRDEGSFQEPIMIGTFAGIPESKDQKLDDKYKGTSGTMYDGVKDIEKVSDINSQNSTDGYLTDSDGNIVTDSSGNAVKTKSSNVLNQVDGVNIPKTDAQKANYKIGEITSNFESNGRIDAINDYKNKAAGDNGGASYGKYQLASYMGAGGVPKSNKANNSPVKRFVNNSKYKDDFAGLVPGTNAFDSKWKEVAARDPEGFSDAQRQYIVDNNYTPTVNKLRTQGVDLSNRGPAVQEMIFSTSTQYGSGYPIQRALERKDINSMTDAEIIEAVQDDKLKNVDSDFKSSNQSIRNGVRNRIGREKKRLMEMAGSDGPIAKEDVDAIKTKQQKDAKTSGGNVSVLPASGVTKPTTIEDNDRAGFQDPYSIYPRKNWINEQDVSRLARNESIEKTIIKAKEQTLINGVGIAGGGSWSEPKSKYNAEYPLNHVHQTESGHTTEFDDTPNAERIHIYHRAGSFVEYHPDGTTVFKSVKDNFEITVNDNNVYVGGNCNITVLGNTNIYSKGMINMESDSDVNIKAGGNLHIGAEKNVYVIGNQDTHIGAGNNIHEGANSKIFMNCSWFPDAISAGDYSVGKITVETYDDDEAVPTIAQQDESKTVQDLQNQGVIDKPVSQPVEATDGTMMSTQEKPVDGMDDLKKTEADKKETKCPREEALGSEPLSTTYSLADLTTSPVLTKVSLQAQAGLTKCEIFDNLSALAKNILEPVRARYGNMFLITSALRTVGTNSRSQHPKGQAVDIQFPGLKASDYVHRIQEISKILPDFDQMILEYHGRSPVIHISFNSAGNRREKKSTPDLKNYFTGFRDSSMGLVYS